MFYRKTKNWVVEFVQRQNQHIQFPAFGLRQLRGSAAMVFEETASHKPHKSGHLDQVVGSRS